MENIFKLSMILLILAAVLLAIFLAEGKTGPQEIWEFLKEAWDIKALITP